MSNWMEISCLRIQVTNHRGAGKKLRGEKKKDKKRDGKRKKERGQGKILIKKIPQQHGS